MPCVLCARARNRLSSRLLWSSFGRFVVVVHIIAGSPFDAFYIHVFLVSRPLYLDKHCINMEKQSCDMYWCSFIHRLLPFAALAPSLPCALSIKIAIGSEESSLPVTVSLIVMYSSELVPMMLLMRLLSKTFTSISWPNHHIVNK